MSLYHICTKGFPDRILFKDKTDFIQGVNRTALAFNGLCKLAAVCLMSNHVHYIAEGNETNAEKAIVRFKKAYSMWFSSRYGDSKIFRRWPHALLKCSDVDYMKEAICYVYKNPAGHSETNNPYYYPWSSINTHFHDQTFDQVGKYIDFKGHPAEISGLKQWQKKEILRTKDEVPESWHFTSDGMVTFDSFVDKTIAEKLFRTERSFNYFIQKRDKDSMNRNIIHLDMEEEQLCCDVTAMKRAFDISFHKFGTADLQTLEANQKQEIMLELVVRYGTPDSIARRILCIR